MSGAEALDCGRSLVFGLEVAEVTIASRHPYACSPTPTVSREVDPAMSRRPTDGYAILVVLGVRYHAEVLPSII